MIVEDYKITEKDIEDAQKAFYGDLSEKPVIEQRLHELQREFLLHPEDKDAKTKFTSEIYDYMKPVLLKQIKSNQSMSKNSKLWIDPEDIDYIVSVAVDHFMKKYKKDQHYIVGASFFGVLKWPAIEAKSDYLHNKHIVQASLDVDLSKDSNKEYTVLNLLEAKNADTLYEESQAIGILANDSLAELAKSFISEQLLSMTYQQQTQYYSFIVRVLYYFKFLIGKHADKTYQENLVQIEYISNQMFGHNYKAKKLVEKSFLGLIKHIKIKIGIEC